MPPSPRRKARIRGGPAWLGVLLVAGSAPSVAAFPPFPRTVASDTAAVKAAADGAGAPTARKSPSLQLTVAPRDIKVTADRIVFQEARLTAPAPADSTPADTAAVAAWDSLVFYLHLPDGFRLMPGTLMLEGDTLRIESDMNPVIATLPPLPPGGSHSLRYAVRSNPHAGRGRHVIQAHVERDRCWVTGNAVAVVDLSADPGHPQETFFGAVFHDRNENGVREEGEPGIAQVGIVMEDGAHAVSDDQGRFAFRVFEGTHLVTLELSTLPEGAHVVGDPDRLYEVSPLGLSQLEFAVASSRRNREVLSGTWDAASREDEHAALVAAREAALEAAREAARARCENLTSANRDAWGGYFTLDWTVDRERYARLRDCPIVPVTDATTEVASVASRGPAGANPAPKTPRPATRPASSEKTPPPATAKATRSQASPSHVTPAPVNRLNTIARSPEVADRVPPATGPVDSTTLTLEVGQKMFGLSSDTLTPGYENMLNSLGDLFRERGMRVGLRTAPEGRRDGPSNSWLDERRLKVAEEALASGRKEPPAGTAPQGAGSNRRSKPATPKSLLQSMTYAESEGRARLLLTLSSEVPYASGATSLSGATGEAALLLILSTGLAPDFRMPEVPEGALLRRLSLDLSDSDGSLLLIGEPVAGTTFRARTHRDPYRIELRFESSPTTSATTSVP